MEKTLSAIPAKRYFTIGEVSELCGVKPYVLRYWEQEFTQLKPMKRRGNRRYYQHHEVLLIRRIRELLYDQGFTISGARNRLSDASLLLRSAPQAAAGDASSGQEEAAAAAALGVPLDVDNTVDSTVAAILPSPSPAAPAQPAMASIEARHLRAELLSIRELLSA